MAIVLLAFAYMWKKVELCAYDKRYEFPRRKLKLLEPLGSGEFGIVYKAKAKGIMAGEKQTIVAVKTLKPSANNEVGDPIFIVYNTYIFLFLLYSIIFPFFSIFFSILLFCVISTVRIKQAIRALKFDLEMLMHVGKHLNVVNLLGAVTKCCRDRTSFQMLVDSDITKQSKVVVPFLNIFHRRRYHGYCGILPIWELADVFRRQQYLLHQSNSPRHRYDRFNDFKKSNSTKW